MKTYKLFVLILTMVIMTFIFTPSDVSASNFMIKTGNYRLELYNTQNLYGVKILNNAITLYNQESPIMLYIYNNKKEDTAYYTGYKTVRIQNQLISATGWVTTDNGSIFRFDDQYNVSNENTIVFSRNVSIEKATSGDIGFATRFGLVSYTGSTLRDYNMFAPGVWYKQNENVVKNAIAADYSKEYFLIKESRLTLPMFSMQNIANGETISLCHKDANLTSEQSEMSDARLIDDDFQFGSIGIKKSPLPALYYNYPSYEGDKNYYGNDMAGTIQGDGMVMRNHPVQTTGVKHSYSLYIKLGIFNDFSKMQENNWRYFYNKYNPISISIDQNLLYKNGIETLSKYFRDDFPGKGTGLPWSVWTLKNGTRDYHLQSGFVGQQAKAGWILLRDGLKYHNDSNMEKGAKIIDFWVNHSMTNSGIPKTDYFCEWNNGYGGWGNDPTFLRTASDCCEGILDAYNTGVKYGMIKTAWLDYCKKYGDFLANRQNDDGSWYRSYMENGSVSNYSKYNTSNVIRFMVRLYITTKEEKYKNSALKAGNWCLENIDSKHKYVGGTPDNDNTIDKEAGVMALNAFNSLYEVTKEEKWLSAAVNAANYAESWVYSYNYNAYPATRWAASGNNYPQWLQVDLQNEYDISRVETMFEFTNIYYKYKVEISLDGVLWKTFVDKSNNMLKPTQMGYVDRREAQKARYVRINILGVEGNSAWASIYEFKVYTDYSCNLAHNKPTFASSEQNVAHAAHYATDGVVTSSPNSPWPQCGIIGQSLVATGHSYTDTFMMAAPAEYFRLYLFTGNSHYLSIAKLLSNNTNAVSDYDGRLGYQDKALMGEGVMANNFSVFYGEECLTWQLAVQLESICEIEDMFGNASVEYLSHIKDQAQLRRANRYNATILNLIPVTTIENGKIYCIVNKHSGKLIDVQGASTENSANIWQYHYINRDGQKWRANISENGDWKFTNIKSGKVIDVEGFSMAEGANISQYTDYNTVNQQWYLINLDGYIILKNKNSGMVIDVVNFDYKDGANITQFTNYETENQLWKFYEVK